MDNRHTKRKPWAKEHCRESLAQRGLLHWNLLQHEIVFLKDLDLGWENAVSWSYPGLDGPLSSWPLPFWMFCFLSEAWRSFCVPQSCLFSLHLSKANQNGCRTKKQRNKACMLAMCNLAQLLFFQYDMKRDAYLSLSDIPANMVSSLIVIAKARRILLC